VLGVGVSGEIVTRLCNDLEAITPTLFRTLEEGKANAYINEFTAHVTPPLVRDVVMQGLKRLHAQEPQPARPSSTGKSVGHIAFCHEFILAPHQHADYMFR